MAAVVRTIQRSPFMPQTRLPFPLPASRFPLSGLFTAYGASSSSICSRFTNMSGLALVASFVPVKIM